MQAQKLIREWTQEGGRKFGWLAVQIPVYRTTLSGWMNGHAVPSAVCRARLSDITGIDLNDAKMWVAAC
jgi:hypothetical protein